MVRYGMFPGEPRSPQHPQGTLWTALRPHNWRPTTAQEWLVELDAATGAEVRRAPVPARFTHDVVRSGDRVYLCDTGHGHVLELEYGSMRLVGSFVFYSPLACGAPTLPSGPPRPRSCAHLRPPKKTHQPPLAPPLSHTRTDKHTHKHTPTPPPKKPTTNQPTQPPAAGGGGGGAGRPAAAAGGGGAGGWGGVWFFGGGARGGGGGGGGGVSARCQAR